MTGLLIWLLASPGWAADLEIDGAGANPEDTLGGAQVYGTVRIVNGGVLYVSSSLTITARSIFVDATSRIDGTGMGVPGILGGGTGAPGGGLAGDAGGGGGHGGIGSAGFQLGCVTPAGGGGGLVGNATDGVIEPGQPGGGVNDGVSNLAAGGAGGAALHLDAELLTILGTIRMNGADGAPAAWGGSGGGAGGSIFLEADVLACDGTLEAKGGDGGGGHAPGGAGGGGIVEVRWDSFGRPCDGVTGGGKGSCTNGSAGLVSGLANQDWDGDGSALIDGDCQTTDALIGPVASEGATCDGIDQNCSGVADEGLTCGFSCIAFAADTTTYLSCETNVTQATALTDCEGLSGGRYFGAVIGSDAENSAIVATVGDVENHWIGLTDVGLEDGWFWDAPVDTSFAHWGAGEPNDAGGEDCGELVTTTGDWNDIACTAAHDFLCERCALLTWYTDADGDGFGDSSLTTEACDFSPPIDGVLLGGDCDDADATLFPNAPEGCDGIDTDCDGTADPLTLTLFVDADLDGFGDPTNANILQSCALAIPVGYTTNAADCDDLLTTVSPDDVETCNGRDDDCNGVVDDDAICEGTVEDCEALHVEDAVYLACNDVENQAGAEAECAGFNYLLASLTIAGEDAVADQLVDRVDPTVEFWIGLEDVVEGVYTWADASVFAFDDWNAFEPNNGGGGGQQDCAVTSDQNGSSEESWFDRPCGDSYHYLCEVACTPVDWFPDVDGDGWGDVTAAKTTCIQPPGLVRNADDCDDSNPQTHPNAAEIPADGIDQDCDVLDACFDDGDGDGFGDPASASIDANGNGCIDVGEADNDSDCNDVDAAVNPSASDVAGSGLDLDCDGEFRCFFDGDGDDAGSALAVPSPDAACSAPYEAQVGGDCDDANPANFPGGIEIVGDGIDQDCDGKDSCYQDLDGDGFGNDLIVVDDNALDCDDGGARSSVGGDCNDASAQAGPGAAEIPADGIDQNCDGGDSCFSDGDGDAAAGATLLVSVDLDCADPGEATLITDCNDADATVFPGAAEVVGDGLDQDCDNRDSCWVDADNDDFGSVVIVIDNGLDCDDGGPRTSVPGDCNDANAQIAPGAVDLPADGIDQDCDGGDACFDDSDNDGFAGDLQSVDSLDLDCTDPGEFAVAADCDDTDNAVFPAAPEAVGDGADQDCDAKDSCWQDLDGDAFGSAIVVDDNGLVCDDGGPRTSVPGDCNDADDTAFPGAPELTGDGVDGDCNGGEVCFFDGDGDGAGTLATVISADLDCFGPGESPTSDDCNDLDAAINPGAAEVAGDGIDQNCDGDDSCFADGDGDGYGSVNPVFSADTDCDDPGESSLSSDCNDADIDISPAGIEALADGVDQDCDGGDTCYEDDDGDGSGSSNPFFSSDLDCTDPGESADDLDCDDNDAASGPGAPEVAADGTDQDCDGGDTCWTDSDGDTFGTATPLDSADLDCLDPGEALNTSDCDDTDPNAFPGAVELVGDAIDEDCDGDETCFLDGDGDGSGTPATIASSDADCSDALESSTNDDCDDADGTIWPGATEFVGDGVDQDCDGDDNCYADADLDGFGDDLALVPSGDLDCDDVGEALIGGDCDDLDDTINPTGTETAGNELDEDCDGALQCFDDSDGDGFGDENGALVASDDLDCSDAGESLDATDCDDADAGTNPDATDVQGDGFDQDCDGYDAVETDTDSDSDTDTDTDLPGFDDRDTTATDTAATGEGCDCDTGSPANPGLAGAAVLLAGLLHRRRRT